MTGTPHTKTPVEGDATEGIRRKLLVQVNADPSERAALEARHDQVWDAAELARDFVVHGFMAPFVVVRRKADGVVGSLMFQHQPRYYFDWVQDSQPNSKAL
ncbi:MAG TPA: hypothetical protein PKI20_21795 [Verrucomicrobiota bacterium]|nr:hypothetical protein [Verrucomicrobiota bacterium]HQL80429.1 hypothetical protein [Verrucomicrobiota bacterium]